MLETGNSRPAVPILLMMIGVLSACENPSVTERQLSRVQDVSLSPSIVAQQSHMRFEAEGSQFVLEFLVIAVDSFQWIDAAESSFGWQILESGQGQLVTRFDGTGGALLDVSNIGDAVHLESDLTIDVIATPNVLLELTGRSLDGVDSGNDNTQEFFFKTGLFEEWSEFVMYDMGGSSQNPSGPDRACSGDEQTPYNRDQLSTRSRIQRTQCWDGFSNAPTDWRDRSTKSMAVDFAEGAARAYLDQIVVAQLDQEMGETIRALLNPVVWVKNVDKGGGEDLLIDAITLFDTSARETDGYVVLRVPIEANEPAVLARPAGVFPPGTEVSVEFSESLDGPFLPQTDPIELTGEFSELFLKILVDSRTNPSGLVLTGVQLEFFR